MEDLGKSIPVAEGFIVSEETTVTQTANGEKHCLNCETLLTGPYCSHCGQKDIPKRQTLGELLTNFISSFWSYESKFFKTWQYLLFKPGFLAAEYNVGRRERFFHPARMYVFISFVFFLLLSSLPDDEKSSNNLHVQRPNEAKPENGTVFTIGEEYKTREQYDSAQNALPEDERDGWLERKLEYRQIDLNNKYRDKGDAFSDEFKAAFLDNFSKVFFWLLPIFALVLKLLYVRRDFYYSEHLVFSIYYYNFFFLAGSLSMLSGLIPYLDFVSIIIGFWIAIYLLLGMKRMYKQGWGKTIIKYFAFCFLFGICAAIALTINVMTILMLI
jgi:hypothetical protein